MFDFDRRDEDGPRKVFLDPTKGTVVSVFGGDDDDRDHDRDHDRR
jgi:hypothetical protein